MVGHKLGEFAFTKKRFKYKCVLFPRFSFSVGGAHRFAQTYEEQVIVLSTQMFFPPLDKYEGFTALVVYRGASIATRDEGSSQVPHHGLSPHEGFSLECRLLQVISHRPFVTRDH